jgi:DNA-binding NtrC family response regulator
MAEQNLRHVLVVEDEETFRRMVVRALGDKRYRITAAEDFESALSIIEQDEPVHLLITDVSLWPGQPNGVVLGNMAQLRRSRLKVIFMSGSYDVEWAAQYGDAAAVLQKPFTVAQLTAAVERALD